MEILNYDNKQMESNCVDLEAEIPAKFLSNIKQTTELANEGDIEAMFALGMMYLTGKEKFQNFESAKLWFSKCNEKGDKRAEKLLSEWDSITTKMQDHKVCEQGGDVSTEEIHWNPKKTAELDLKFHNKISFIYNNVLWSSILYIVGTIIYVVCSIIVSEYVDSFVIAIDGAIFSFLGIKGAFSLKKRYPNAPFICMLYSWILVVSRILNLILVEYPKVNVIWLVYGIIVLYLLYCSHDMKLIFPKEYRKVSKSDKILAFACIGIEALIWIAF